MKERVHDLLLALVVLVVVGLLMMFYVGGIGFFIFCWVGLLVVFDLVMAAILPKIWLRKLMGRRDG